ncbi:uncharacterized protein DDB_G0285291-like [Homarus americanus]|uniref:uncharacterized protein DDB_G0285291-like n=1 Tax=Homarus americanus TaxID=6706 RepID=UPI001C438F97|nr:uncharacterized protein DDB_G0285291-like [Homarus americanus]
MREVRAAALLDPRFKLDWLSSQEQKDQLRDTRAPARHVLGGRQEMRSESPLVKTLPCELCCEELVNIKDDYSSQLQSQREEQKEQQTRLREQLEEQREEQKHEKVQLQVKIQEQLQEQIEEQKQQLQQLQEEIDKKIH